MNAHALMDKAERAAISARVLLDHLDADGACNRAYYAMFDAARAALLSNERVVGRTHKGVLAAFSEHLVKENLVPKEMGRLLKQAETRRYVADYEGAPVELGDAHELVAQAEAFVAAIRSTFLPQPDGKG